VNDAPRLLVLWCPDWPVVAAGAAAGTPLLAPAAVFSANRVVACSAAARRSGVGRGMRRRDAQSRCPGLVVHQHDPDRDARVFEPVAAAVEQHAVGVEVVRPGVVAVPVGGAAGYFGGEEALAERLLDEVSANAGVEC
jgi:protein ImuB